MMKTNLKKNVKNAIAPAVLLGAFFTLGFFIKRNGVLTFSFDKLGFFLLSALAFLVVAVLLYMIIDGLNGTKKERTKEFLPNRLFKRSWLYGIFAFVLLLVMWVPTFLALYPGLFVYDAPWQYTMYYTNEVTAHHPVLHTYLMVGIMDKVFTMTGAINKAAAAYTLVQMGIMALGEAYIMYVFHREKVNTVFHVIALAFWGLFPVCDIFLVTMTKDSIFSVAVADLVVLTVLLLKKPEAFLKKTNDYIFWIFFALEVLIFRNNAKYALIIVLPFFVVSLIKAIKKSEAPKKFGLYFKGLLMLVLTIAIFVIYDIPVTKAITVEGTSTAEMLSVPCQQLARVYNYRYSELSNEQIDTIERLFQYDGRLHNYVPQQATNTKAIIDTDLVKEDKGKYLSFWVKTGLQFPGEYINSFLMNTYAFWYPWPEYVIYNNGGKTYIPMYSIVPVEQNPKLMGLFEFYQGFAKGEIVEGNDFVSWVFSPALYFYIFVLVAGYFSRQKKSWANIPVLFITLLWMTYLLGPVAQVRYAAYLFYLLPCWCMILSDKKAKTEEVTL